MAARTPAHVGNDRNTITVNGGTDLGAQNFQVQIWTHGGSGESAAEAPVNVASGSPYYDAILRAVDLGVTTGYTDGAFRPGAICNRGQIVTFLCRNMGPKADA